MLGIQSSRNTTNGQSLAKRLAAVWLSLAFLLLGTATTAQAASQCKGLNKGVCTAKSDCGWTNGYKRSDGRKVNGYCRAASGKAKKANSSASKNKSSRSADSNSSTKKSANKKSTNKSSDAKKANKKAKKNKDKKNKDKK